MALPLKSPDRIASSGTWEGEEMKGWHDLYAITIVRSVSLMYHLDLGFPGNGHWVF